MAEVENKKMKTTVGEIPPLNDHNAWAKFWYYDKWLNVIPAKTRIKKTFVKWKEDGYQTKRIPEETFQQWIRNNEFADGMAIILGNVYGGEHKGEYFTFIDLDNLKAVEEFCTRNGKIVPLRDISEKFIVEQHLDNLNKAHVFFYSKIPFASKSSDANIISDRNQFDKNLIPAFEVKGMGTHGIAYCTPSHHKNGHRYQIIGTTNPVILTVAQGIEMMQHIDDICKRHGLHYLGENGKAQKKLPVSELVKEGSVIIEGNNRHNGLLKMSMSLVSLLRGRWPTSVIKKMAFEIANKEYCVPPIDKEEFDRNVWKSVEKYLPPDEERYEQASKKALEEIAAAAAAAATTKEEERGEGGKGEGEDPNKMLLERSISDVIRMNKGQAITRGKIVGVSPIYKMITKVTLTCPTCQGEWPFNYDKGMPAMSFKQNMKYCTNCKKPEDNNELRIEFEHIDAKSISVQDPEDLQDDLEKLHVVLLGDNTRNVRIGETAIITGNVSVLNPSGLGGKKPTTVMFATYIRYEREEEAPITEDDIILFEEFAAKPDVNIINQLVDMFAPQVIGHSDAKLGILRSAVNVRESKHLTGIRSRTHTVLAGDPGTAKTMLANEATKIVPNSRYVTAQHASIKSVLAIIDKEPDNSKMLLLGAVPQARNAICSINEIGSMDFEDQQHLADIFEEGRFTINKYGIYQELDSPTTIIVTTNPGNGYWDRSVGPSLDQVPIKSNIRDRFDQIYIFEDFQTPEECREYAMQKMEICQNPELAKPDYDFLKRYLQYAASLPDPVLTPEATIMLSDFWIRMKAAGYGGNRSLDSLVRIARGQARLHLREEIDPDIVKEVIQDVQLMFVNMGKMIDPSVEDPVSLTYNAIIQYANTLQAPITFIEAAKHVWNVNNSIKQYLGSNNPKWSNSENKRLRHVHERFADGATVGTIKVGRGDLAVKIDRLHPLTIVKSVKQEVEEEAPKIANNNKEESNSEMSGHDLYDHMTVTEEGQNKKTSSENGVVNTKKPQESSVIKVIWSSPDIIKEECNSKILNTAIQRAMLDEQ